MIAIHHPWVFAFGLLGNAISFMVFLSPLPTFIRIYKKKSTEGFQSVPYVVAIFSCLLWIYYALLKGNTILLITINTVGVVIEIIYIAIYISYAPRQAKISTLKLLLILNFGGFCAIVLLCHYLVKGDARIQVFGWICVAISISVFAAPLSIMRLVIRTKSVEYMPFNLSISLTFTAVVWFMYGLLQKDLYVTLPNVVGFIFGLAQMTLYGLYRKYDKDAQKQKLPEQIPASSSPAKQSNVEIHPITSLPPTQHDDVILPPRQPHVDQEIEIEIEIEAEAEAVFVNPENKDSNWAIDDRLHGPTKGPACSIEAQSTIGVPGPAFVQLIDCAV